MRIRVGSRGAVVGCEADGCNAGGWPGLAIGFSSVATGLRSSLGSIGSSGRADTSPGTVLAWMMGGSVAALFDNAVFDNVVSDDAVSDSAGVVAVLLIMELLDTELWVIGLSLRLPSLRFLLTRGMVGGFGSSDGFGREGMAGLMETVSERIDALAPASSMLRPFAAPMLLEPESRICVNRFRSSILAGLLEANRVVMRAAIHSRIIR